ncbi:glycerol-3-phosphate 1-O-acyltransferase PlsY [Acetivibrio cellulolyticus]|uniref:glycerol-3-phosphate 1-O-acyltransferase PlsY n=1 Tax=Acetivibrio cellulolyticus TaxID=35830 RepID=UPI0001E2D460|nr:glycerol-3-phosphate 1-O-acyltransferase PlsY [Acetivibrio cellulolyticus]
MDVFVKVFLALLIGYLLGSANTSLIVGKFYGVDVRKHGSGNAGLTNTMRTIGKVAALFVILGDILKGVLSCLIGYYILKDIQIASLVSSIDIPWNVGMFFGGLGAILGHNWPLYFGFKGGKGILTTFSVVMMTAPYIGLVLLGIFVVIVAITRYVSLGSIIGSALFPVFIAIFYTNAVFVIFAAFVAILAIARHNQNIVRLINGTESKFGSKKKTEG